MNRRCSHAVARFGVPKPSAGVDQISSRRPVAVSGGSRRLRQPSFAPVIGHRVMWKPVTSQWSAAAGRPESGAAAKALFLHCHPSMGMTICEHFSASGGIAHLHYSSVDRESATTEPMRTWIMRMEVMTVLLLMACMLGNQVCFWLRR